MFWEEKIDRLSKRYKQDDFKVPFTIASSILKKIEDMFIVKSASDQQLNYWTGNIKSQTLIKSIQINHLYSVGKIR